MCLVKFILTFLILFTGAYDSYQDNWLHPNSEQQVAVLLDGWIVVDEHWPTIDVQHSKQPPTFFLFNYEDYCANNCTIGVQFNQGFHQLIEPDLVETIQISFDVSVLMFKQSYNCLY